MQKTNNIKSQQNGDPQKIIPQRIPSTGYQKPTFAKAIQDKIIKVGILCVTKDRFKEASIKLGTFKPNDKSRIQFSAQLLDMDPANSNFDCLMIYFQNQSDLRMLKMYIEGFRHMPIKVYFGDVPIKGIIDAQSFMISEAVLCCKHIEYRFETEVKKYTELFTQLANKNNHQLPRENFTELLKKLGSTIQQEEINDLVCSLDFNGTGFIEHESLLKVWLSGLKVDSGLIGHIKKIKGKVLSFTHMIDPMLKDVLSNMNKTQMSKTSELFSKNDVTINFNEAPTGKNIQTQIAAEIELYSDKAQKRYDDLKKLHPSLKLTKNERIWNMTIILDFKITENQTKALEYLAKFLSTNIGQHVSFSAQGCALSLATSWNYQKLGSSELFEEKLKKKIEEFGIQQSFEITANFAFDLGELLEVFESEDAYGGEDEGDEYGQEPEPSTSGAKYKGLDIPTLMMRGVSFRIKTNLWKPFSVVLLDMAKQNKDYMKDKGYLMSLFSFLMQTKGALNFKVDRDQFKYIGQNPFVDIFMIGGQEYLERLTATSSDEFLLDTLAEDVGLPKNFNKLTTALFTKEDRPGSVQIDLTNGQTAFSVNLKSNSGMRLVTKSIIRILSSLEKTDEMELF